MPPDGRDMKASALRGTATQRSATQRNVTRRDDLRCDATRRDATRRALPPGIAAVGRPTIVPNMRYDAAGKSTSLFSSVRSAASRPTCHAGVAFRHNARLCGKSRARTRSSGQTPARALAPARGPGGDTIRDLGDRKSLVEINFGDSSYLLFLKISRLP